MSLQKNKKNPFEVILSIGIAAIVLFLFLISILLIGESFKLLGTNSARELLLVVKNPFVGLFIGMLSTAIVQSSSTTTAIIVTLVASGQYSLQDAVPAIMGANIGTSVTSTIVAFGHITKKKKYRRAIAAASVHDFFNILLTIILLPLEYFFGLLSNTAMYLVSFIGPVSNETFQITEYSLKPIAVSVIDFFGANPLILIPLSLISMLCFFQLVIMLLKKKASKNEKNYFDKVAFKKPLKTFFWGFGLTAVLQSSSVTTSLIVPVVAAKKVSVKKVFPFLMGANLGTTVTAFIVALSLSKLAIAVAMVHFLFNFFGILLFFPFSALRNIPIRLAVNLGRMVEKNQAIGFFYILSTFFLVPFVMILISNYLL